MVGKTNSPLSCVAADEVPDRKNRTSYPPPFAQLFVGREKKALGNFFGLSNFGVNLTRLAPGAISSLRHSHTLQDEFVYILAGHPTLYTDAGAMPMSPGMCAGFKAGSGDAHRLVNESYKDAVYLEIGDRTAGDEVSYPDVDLVASERAGIWVFRHKDGKPY